MADYLCQRAIDHASSRVQFPGLFHDEEAHDTIVKFGAVKKMIAEMAAGRQLIKTLDSWSATGFSDADAIRGNLFKAVAAEVLGTAPGSVAYNAGQVFGGDRLLRGRHIIEVLPRRRCLAVFGAGKQRNLCPPWRRLISTLDHRGRARARARVWATS